MKILLDENIPRMTLEAPIDLGHDVLDVRGTTEEGASDEGLWRIAREEQRLLVTTDKGFSARRDSQHAGILIMRDRVQSCWRRPADL